MLGARRLLRERWVSKIQVLFLGDEILSWGESLRAIADAALQTKPDFVLALDVDALTAIAGSEPQAKIGLAATARRTGIAFGYPETVSDAAPLAVVIAD